VPVFPSQDWLTEYVEQINSSKEYEEAASSWEGDLSYVFEREPEVTEALLELENVVLVPHLGSATRAAREAMGMLCVDALRAVLLEGRRPANAVV